MKQEKLLVSQTQKREAATTTVAAAVRELAAPQTVVRESAEVNSVEETAAREPLAAKFWTSYQAVNSSCKFAGTTTVPVVVVPSTLETSCPGKLLVPSQTLVDQLLASSTISLELEAPAAAVRSVAVESVHMLVPETET